MIELLIVITILGILLAATTPAIQSSREAARKLQCKNNLKQIGLAAQQHLNSWGYFPSSGWGWLWAGDPDRGFGANQPGGWVYSLLPFIEEKQLWSIGQGISFAKNPTEKQNALAGQLNQPIPLLICPSRRDAALYPYDHARAPLNLNLLDLAKGVLKTDYAINAGDTGPNQYPGPKSMASVDSGKYNWPADTGFDGISYQRSQVTTSEVLDGLSHTYLVGEKYLRASDYTNGADLGDNEAATQGFDNDMCRIAGEGNGPMQDRIDEEHTSIFGSVHPEGFQMVFCDGSVHLIDYGISPEVHSNLANREDGQSISSPSIH